MANDLTKAMGNVPAHIAARMGNTTPAIADNISGGLSQGGVPRISLKGSRFRIVENGAEIKLRETELEVIIVGANKNLSKTFYAKPWNPDDEPTAPDCFSLDGVFPDASIADPPGERCATCPKNQWGSKLTPAGKQIKACSDQKRLAVVAAGDPGTVYLVQVTPAALQGLAKYNGELKARGLQPDMVITSLSFDGDASYPKLQFSFGGFPDEGALDAVDTLDKDEIIRVTTGDMSITTPSKVEPKAEPEVKAKPKPKLAAVEDDDDDDDAVPLVKAKPKAKPVPVEDEAEEPAPQPKAKPKLHAVEDDDDDDETVAAFAKKKPSPDIEVETKAKPKARKPKAGGAVIETNDDDEPEVKAKPKADARMAGLVDTISARLGGMYEDDDDGEDGDDA